MIRVSCLALGLYAAQAWAQTTGQPVPKIPPPTPIVYHLFFTHIGVLDQKATESEAAGKPGDSLRRYYQRKIGLTDSEHTAMLQRAASCRSAVGAQDAAAKKRIAELQRQYPPSRQSGQPPAVIAELDQMEADRLALLEDHIARLRTEMGVVGYQKVDAFIKNELVRNTSITPLSSNPAGSLAARRAAAVRALHVR